MAAKRSTITEQSEITPVVQEHDVTREIRPLNGTLEVTVTTLFKVNFGIKGNYGEGTQAFAAVKGVFDADLDPDELGRYLDEKVFSLIAPQLEVSKTYADNKSFIHHIPIGDE